MRLMNLTMNAGYNGQDLADSYYKFNAIRSADSEKYVPRRFILKDCLRVYG